MSQKKRKRTTNQGRKKKVGINDKTRIMDPVRRQGSTNTQEENVPVARVLTGKESRYSTIYNNKKLETQTMQVVK